MGSLSGKVALVTGATRGIGRGIVLHLAQEGASVVINYHTQDQEARELVQHIEESGGQALAVHGDISNLSDIHGLFSQSLSHFGRIDIVVANAGLPAIGVPMVDVTEEQFDRLYAINAKGTFFLMQEAARHLANGGRIVDVSSSTTQFPAAGFSLHASSKAGSRVVVEVLAHELGPRGITVNTVMPGGTDTAFLKDAPPEELERIRQASPLGRMGRVDDIVGVIAFLVSDDARWITGQHLLANGGARV